MLKAISSKVVATLLPNAMVINKFKLKEAELTAYKALHRQELSSAPTFLQAPDLYQSPVVFRARAAEMLRNTSLTRAVCVDLALAIPRLVVGKLPVDEHALPETAPTTTVVSFLASKSTDPATRLSTPIPGLYKTLLGGACFAAGFTAILVGAFVGGCFAALAQMAKMIAAPLNVDISVRTAFLGALILTTFVLAAPCAAVATLLSAPIYVVDFLECTLLQRGVRPSSTVLEETRGARRPQPAFADFQAAVDAAYESALRPIVRTSAFS